MKPATFKKAVPSKKPAPFAEHSAPLAGGGSSAAPAPAPATLSSLRLPLFCAPNAHPASAFHPFQGGIQQVLAGVHPDLSITALGARILSTMLDDVLERLVKLSVSLAAEAAMPMVLVTSRQVQTAVRLVFPGELRKHAACEGIKACSSWIRAQQDKVLGSEQTQGLLQFSMAAVAARVSGAFAPASHFSATAIAYATAVLEYLCAELLQLSGYAAQDLSTVYIGPRLLLLAVRGDEELSRLFPGTIPYGGVVPDIHSALLPRTCSVKVAYHDLLFGALSEGEEAALLEAAGATPLWPEDWAAGLAQGKSPNDPTLAAQLKDVLEQTLGYPDEEGEEEEEEQARLLSSGQALYAIATGGVADQDDLQTLLAVHSGGAEEGEEEAEAGGAEAAEAAAAQSIAAMYKGTPLVSLVAFEYGVDSTAVSGLVACTTRTHASGTPLRANDPVVLVGDIMEIFSDYLHCDEELQEFDRKAELEELEGCMTPAALSAWAHGSAAAALGITAKLQADVPKMAGKVAVRSTVSWAAEPMGEDGMDSLQPYTPTPIDLAQAEQLRLALPRALLQAYAKHLTPLCQQAAAAAAAAALESELALGPGRLAAALASLHAASALAEAAAGGAPLNPLQAGTVAAALQEGDALLPRLEYLTGERKWDEEEDKKKEEKGGGEGAPKVAAQSEEGAAAEEEGEKEEEEEEEEEEPEGYRGGVGTLQECLARALAVLGAAHAPEGSAAAPSLPGLLLLPPSVASHPLLDGVRSSFAALQQSGASGDRGEDLAAALRGWKAVATVYALSGNAALQARAALFLSRLQVSEIVEAQGLGGGATALVQGHDCMAPRPAQRSCSRQVAKGGGRCLVPNAIPLASLGKLVQEISDDFKTDLTWAPEALEALRCAVEDYAVGLMGEASLESIHGNRSIIYPKDLKLAQRCRGERG